MNQPAKPQVQRSQCSIQHGRNHTANNIYKCWTSCNKCKYLFLQYSVSNQKHNSCKIYLKILQVVSKGRKISWLAGGVIGYVRLYTVLIIYYLVTVVEEELRIKESVMTTWTMNLDDGWIVIHICRLEDTKTMH